MTRFVSAILGQLGSTTSNANQPNVDFARLEDRVLFSASPLAEALLTSFDGDGGAFAAIEQLDDIPLEPLADVGIDVYDTGSTNGSVLTLPGERSFDAGNADYLELAHTPSWELEQGTISFWFTADSVEGKNALFSKDAADRQQGGITALVEDGRLKVRLENEIGPQWLVSDYGAIAEGEQHHVAITFGEQGFWLFLDGEIQGRKTFWKENLSGNTEDLLIGATGWIRDAENPDKAHHRFDGTIADFTIFDSQLSIGAVADLAGVGEQPLDEPTVIDGVLHGTDNAETLDAAASAVNHIRGGLGDDLLVGGAGNDVLDGGFGQDRLEGGAGDDLLLSRSDGGGSALQSFAAAFDPVTQTSLENPTIAANDVFVGGAGGDTFRFEVLLNANSETLIKRADAAGNIDWNEVSGRSEYADDRWAEGIGHDAIWDFNRAEGDSIEIVGQPIAAHKLTYVDLNADGLLDATVIDLYAIPGATGANASTSLGSITVVGDLLTPDDFTVDNSATIGVIENIHDLDHAQRRNDQLTFGAKDPILPPLPTEPLPAGGVFQLIGEHVFDGTAREDVIEVVHTPNLELSNGTIAFAFNADAVEGKNALFSKDVGGRQAGSITALIEDGRLAVRMENSGELRWLKSDAGPITAGEEHHVAISFGDNGFWLYLDGEIQSWASDWTQDLTDNTENLLIGAAGWTRDADNPDRATRRFDGAIADFQIYDNQFSHEQVAELAGVETDDGSDPADDEPELPGDLIAEDPPVFDITDFGAIADGETDARDAIVAALNAAAATDGPAEVHIPEGTYEVSSEINHLFRSDLRIFGEGTLITDDTILLRSGNGSMITLEDFTITPSSTSVTTALEVRATGKPSRATITADSSIGEGSIEVSDGENFKEGDLVWVVSDELWRYDPVLRNRDPHKGELQRITEVSGSTIKTSDPLWNSYDVADDNGSGSETVTVSGMTPIRVKIDGISIDYGEDVWTSENTIGLRLSTITDSEISNLYTRGAAHSGMKLSRSYNVTVSNCEFVDDGDADKFLGYGAQVSSSTDVHFIDCNSTNTRHAIDFIAGDTPVHRASVTGGVFVGHADYGSPLSTHPGANFITFSDLTVVGGKSGIVIRSPNTTVENITFVQPSREAIKINGGTGAQIINNTMTLDPYAGYSPTQKFGETFLKVQEPDGSITFDADPTATDELVVRGNVTASTVNFIESKDSTNGTWRRVVIEDNVVTLQNTSASLAASFIEFQDDDMRVLDSVIRNNVASATGVNHQSFLSAEAPVQWESTVIEGNSGNLFLQPVPL